MAEGYLTKINIFDEATRLFAERGCEKVTMKEIGAAVGISEPGVYHYYESKLDILDEIIAEFRLKLQGYILTKKQVDKYIETDTTRELLERCIGRFTEDDDQFMARAYRIVCMEHMTNETAMDLIVFQLHDATAESIRYVLDSLIERGKIPAFDTWFLSLLWAQSMFSSAVVWVSNYFNGHPREKSAAQFNTAIERVVDMAMTGQIPQRTE